MAWYSGVRKSKFGSCSASSCTKSKAHITQLTAAHLKGAKQQLLHWLVNHLEALDQVELACQCVLVLQFGVDHFKHTQHTFIFYICVHKSENCTICTGRVPALILIRAFFCVASLEMTSFSTDKAEIESLRKTASFLLTRPHISNSQVFTSSFQASSAVYDSAHRYWQQSTVSTNVDWNMTSLLSSAALQHQAFEKLDHRSQAQ